MDTNERTTEAEELVRQLGERWAEAESGGDVQTLAALLADDFMLQGRDASGRFRVTQVAVERDGRWPLAGIHLSPIAPPGAPGR